MGEKGTGSVWEAGFPRWWEAEEIPKNYTTLHNILQSKGVKRWELAKNGAGTLRIEGYGKWEFEPPVTCTCSETCINQTPLEPR